MNNRQFPDLQYEPNYTADTGEYVREFTSLLQYDKQLFDPQAGGSISYVDYGTLYPIYHFDFTAQQSGIFKAGSTADVEVRWKTRSTPSSNYHVVVVLVSEAGVEFLPIAESRVRLAEV